MHRSVLLLRMLRFLQVKASDRTVAEVEALLANGHLICVRAGGISMVADPAGGDASTYEVLLDHDPPRFWIPYGNGRQSLFTRVPRLLLCHLIIRSGGIASIGYTVRPAPEPLQVRMTLTVPAERRSAVEGVLRGFTGVQISQISMQNAPV